MDTENLISAPGAVHSGWTYENKENSVHIKCMNLSTRGFCQVYLNTQQWVFCKVKIFPHSVSMDSVTLSFWFVVRTQYWQLTFTQPSQPCVLEITFIYY